MDNVKPRISCKHTLYVLENDPKAQVEEFAQSSALPQENRSSLEQK